MLNQRGAALPLVLMAIIIFSILGLSILSAAVNGAKRANIQTQNYQNTQVAIEELEKVVAEIITEIEDRNIKPENSDYHNQISNLIDSISDVSITDLTIANFGTTSTPNKAFLLSKTIDEDGRKKTISRNLYLSSYPSFLNYVAGTHGGVMTINGAARFNGNINAKNLIVSNIAEFKQGSGESSIISTYPEINGDIFVEESINGINKLNHPDIFNYFEDPDPTIYPPKEDFVDVNFIETFKKKLNQALKSNYFSISDDITNETLMKNVIKNVVQDNCINAINSYQPLIDDDSIFDGGNCINNYYIIENDLNQSLFNDATLTPPDLSGKKVILFTDTISIEDVDSGELRFNDVERGVFSLSENFKIDEDAWLIVHGDLIIESNNDVEIDGNILVTGDLIIQGNEGDDKIYFNSIIYCLGTSTINNTNILGLTLYEDKDMDGINDESQLVLLTRNNLMITRINEFATVDDITEPLRGYFYTDSYAELYGVGSLFHIKGGLFASNGLEINAVRGNVSNSGNILNFTSPAMGKPRFIVDYDDSVILNHLDVLPVVDRIRVILDDYIFE
ncbi:type IV pilus modification PilV family protein [Calidifontibacillus oryziterrae]|uniref:type IV pilus modification PilV family protein n=1 Tax=Calidifontibacillus oryziterrae TaxID=1191699 RepID=UPI0002F61BDD|nr:type II secretion system protein [Calidifontibacillus oryziterrae]